MRHLPGDKYLCGYCDYKSPLYRESVRRHMEVNHPDQPIHIIDKTIELKADLADFRDLCFPVVTRFAPRVQHKSAPSKSRLGILKIELIIQYPGKPIYNRSLKMNNI